jgi:protein farnesyltransferase/geranylgeranyltransferase type-1 subunit alpha
MIEELLEVDVRNNSAWNQRFFVVSNTTDMSLSVRQREVEWALAKASLAPNNESAWSYIRGVIGSHPLTDFPKLIEALDEYCQREHPPAQCVEFMADVAVQRGTADARQEACALLERLATELDVVRARYWWSRKQVGCLMRDGLGVAVVAV